MERPTSIDQAAAIIRELANTTSLVRPRGGATKLGWIVAHRSERTTIELDTRGLNRVLEHNAGDFTAVLEAGITLADAQAVFAGAGQMLALDPPTGIDQSATLGGILAANDSGPLRHRYGSIRDLVIGITVVLSDGTIAKSGGKVIKNVAGYDLAKLFTGSFGTLGLVAQVAVRLHPLPAQTTTLVASSADATRLAATVARLTRLPIEADSIDVNWSAGSGTLLVRFAGAAAEQRAQSLYSQLEGVEANVVGDDEPLWSSQRTRQRTTDGIMLKVSGRPADLPALIRATVAARGSLTMRAALGLSWIRLPFDCDIASLRRSLAPRSCTVLDGAERVPDPWPGVDSNLRTLMQRVKQRFDPAGIFRPGEFVGGI